MTIRAGLLTGLLLVSSAASATEPPPSVPEILELGVEVVTLDGERVPLAAVLAPGRPLIVEFWATWCVPCHKTFPHLVELKKKHGDRLGVLGLTVEDPEQDLDKVKKFVERYGVNFEIAFAPDELFHLMNRRMDIAVPKLFVFGSDGSLVSYVPRHSPLTPFKLRSAVAEALRNQGAHAKAEPSAIGLAASEASAGPR